MRIRMERTSKKKFETVDQYLLNFPESVVKKLELIRATVKCLVPEAEELISYNMPAFKIHGLILIYFAAYKAHLSIYPGNVKVFEIFREELADYKTSKGTIQFPLTIELPINLIERIIIFRVKQNWDRKTSKIT